MTCSILWSQSSPMAHLCCGPGCCCCGRESGPPGPPAPGSEIILQGPSGPPPGSPAAGLPLMPPPVPAGSAPPGPTKGPCSTPPGSATAGGGTTLGAFVMSKVRPPAPPVVGGPPGVDRPASFGSRKNGRGSHQTLGSSIHLQTSPQGCPS